ncbi:MAG: SPOR domain-containing protein [Roseivivax sp.]|nr:SPOR domain-containing protein [Roseivivax sp.]
MATYFETTPQGASVRNVATLANWAGAAVSLAMVLGVGVWGYRLMVRDVSGIPVVMAAEGPMRIAPEDPGGEAADHQGLSVNDVAGTQASAPLADRVVLAPGAVGLADDDLTPAAMTPEPAPALAADPALATDPAAEGATVENANLPAPADDETMALMALADRIAAGVKPLDPLALSETVEQDAAASAELAAEAATEAATPGTGLRRSLVPVLRPANLVRVSDAAPTATSVAAAPQEVAPEAIAKGASLVQLGAFDTPDTARDAWTRVAGQFSAYFDGKSRVIQKANAGGRDFYRLRAAGFEELADARRFCAALLAEQAECIPVTAR